jgi:hypothetical protein
MNIMETEEDITELPPPVVQIPAAPVITNNAVLVLDNGADTFKLGYGGQPDSLKYYRTRNTSLLIRIFGNYIAKSKREKANFIGNVDTSRDKPGLSFRRPFDRVHVFYTVFKVQRGI